MIDHDLRDARIARQIITVAAEGNHFTRRTEAVAKDQAGNDDVLAAKPEVRLSRKHHLARCLGSKCNRLFSGSPPGNYDFEITPFAIRQSDRVTRLQIPRNISVLLLRADQVLFCMCRSGDDA